jgi:hypothetical protein
MIFSCVFAKLHPRRSPTTPAISHLPYTLPSSVSRKSFLCHSYENCRGVYQQFPFRNSPHSGHFPFFSDTCGDPILQPLCFQTHARMGGVPPASQSSKSQVRKPFICNTYARPASVANKRLTSQLNPLDATLTKNPGVGDTHRRPEPGREASVMAKRKILAELIEGVEAMRKHREGKLTLRSYTVEVTRRGKPRPYNEHRTISTKGKLGLAPGEEGVGAVLAGIGELGGFAGAEIDGDERRVAPGVIGIEDGFAVGRPMRLDAHAVNGR